MTVTTPVPQAPVEPLPVGFGLDLDVSVRQLAPELIAGGLPMRVLRLTPAGVLAWADLLRRPVRTRAEGLLARRLVDTGLAHPVPPAGGVALTDVTVVVPAHDRPQALDRCLAGLGRSARVVVVDDASAGAAEVAAVAAAHGARLVRREVNGGPGAARNTGLDAVDTPVVAFVDSDCVPPEGWLVALLAHLADPQVAAVAPRIVGTPPPGSTSAAGRYTAARGALDLGPTASRVRPDARVAYVPTAALVVRRSALRDVARDGAVFDPALRYGEDVDLVWRLDAAGWHVRYQPETCVEHREPDRWPAVLGRRFRYGTSAAPLAAAHRDRTAPLVLMPWPTLAVAALLARRPGAAAVATGAAALRTRRQLRQAQVPATRIVATTVEASHGTWLHLGRYLTQFAAPALVAAVALPGRPGRRLAATSLLLGGPLTAWWPRRRALDPVRFTAGYLADEIAYGTGVWAASLRRRTLVPLRPRVARRAARPAARPSRLDIAHPDEGVTP